MAAIVLSITLPVDDGRAATPDLAKAAEQALVRAVAFFRTKAAIHGSYVWIYAADLSARRGEGKTTATQGWAQPPGTPAVGLAYLEAYERTGRRELLDAAVETAHALAETQLASGGWWALIEFDNEGRKAWCYRTGPECRGSEAARKNKARDATTIDDDTSQSALRLLMRVDRRIGGRDARIHDAVVYGLEKFLDAQYPNGAWPNRFDRAVSAREVPPVQRARMPSTWPRTYQKIEDPVFYILNDDAIRDVILTLLLAHRLYGVGDYLTAAMKGGDFLLESQMPAPQRGWAQIYDRNMEPIWGRKFEPPAIVSRETRGCLQALLALYQRTGEARYLAGARDAARWLISSRRPDGRWARFYELGTNRPLYMTADYKLTYRDDAVPRHYSFVGSYDIPQTLALYDSMVRRRAKTTHATSAAQLSGRHATPSTCLAPRVAKVVGNLDRAGRWVEDGKILSATFIANISLLSRYVAAARVDRAAACATGQSAESALERQANAYADRMR